jgi:hypothetical protein
VDGRVKPGHDEQGWWHASGHLPRAVFHGMIAASRNKGFACTSFAWPFSSAL